MIPLLYVGAANLVQPNSGMDTASRCHLDELFDDGRFAVTAISAAASPFDPALRPSRPARVFSADLGPSTGRLQRWRLKAGLLAGGGILYQTGFQSARARAAIKAELATRPAVLVVDHINAMANISIWQLLRLRLQRQTKIVVVAHDISAMLLLDRAAIQTSRVKAFAVRLHALHCHLYENLVFRLAHRVWFLSADDRQGFRYADRARSDAGCQIVEWPDVDPESALATKFEPYLLFVGSPSFFPNAAALEWITHRFAPELLKRMPELSILLVGKGTDRADAAGLPNLHGLGFVEDDELHRLVRRSTGTLSPIVHGAGIKIKVLEAVAAGSPVFATEHSLRGYQFLQIEPLLGIDDAAGSAERVCAVISNPDALRDLKERVARRWADFKQVRRGRLAEFAHGLVATPRREPVRHLAERVLP